MESTVRVSVVCNVYNHAAYLQDTLKGFVTQQTNFPFEVLIHDDASTDGSAEIIREYEKNYPDIIKPIYQQENQYSKKIPINKTFQFPRIKGDYVAVCEGDDYWTDPLKLQKQYDFMEAHPDYTMCGCSIIWMDMRTNKTKSWLCRTSVSRDVSLEEIITEKKGRIIQTASFFVKKDIFCDRPDWTYCFGVGDTPLLMYAALEGKVYMLAEEMAVYRNQAAGSWTARISGDVQRKVDAYNKVIFGFTEFNKATDYRYDEVVTSRIKRIRYNIARVQRDLKTMRTGELREVYLSRKFSARMMDVLACKAPPLYKLAMKMFR